LSRTLFCLAAVAALGRPCLAGETTTNSEMLIRLNVRAAAAPKPALRYRLLPELREMNPGNPIQHYMKCMMEQKKFFFDEAAFQYREKLLAMPLKELPTQDLEDYGRYALSQADWAARLDAPDWQILLKLKADGIELLLPEVQQIRSLARALAVRYRAEVAQARFDDAIRTAKTMFAIARHLGGHPTFIGDLVGIAIASITIVPLEEMLEQPGCPNLYWALTALPSPLVPIDKGMEGERMMQDWVFRDFNESAPMSNDQFEQFIADTSKRLELVEDLPKKPGLRVWLMARAKDEAVVKAARERLVEHGFSEERLQRFPAGQVILMDEKRELADRFDDVVKTIGVPYWQVEALAPKTKVTKPPAIFADALLPFLGNVRHSQGRVDQRIALLRHVEGLRLYAALHNNSFPTKLADITVPLPVDPFTGKSFRYELVGKTAHLHGTPPSGMEKVPAYNIHYEVNLQN
jgi:hypothetical protein